MIQTLKGLRDRCCRILDDSSTTTQTLVNDALNYAHQQRCLEHPWAFMLWPRVETFTTVPGQSTYSLHYEYDKPLYLYNRTTNLFLAEVPTRQLVDLVAVTPTTADAPQFFTIAGYSPLAAQPATPARIALVSTDSADTGGENQIVLKGETASGQIVAEILTPFGTTPTISGYAYTHVLALTKETEWRGMLTISAYETNTVLGYLLPSEMGRKYPQLQFTQAPTAVNTIEYRFYRQPLVLINDYDQPDLPSAYAQLLVWDALIQMSAYLTELDASKLNTWRQLQDQALFALRQSQALDTNVGNLVPGVRLVASEA